MPIHPERIPNSPMSTHQHFGPVDPSIVPALSMFTRQLGAMLEAGVSVTRALRVASQNSQSDRLIEAANDLSIQLVDGRELYEGMARHPDLFDPFYLEMVRQGEEDGVLGGALSAVAEYLDELPTTAAKRTLIHRPTQTAGVLKTLGELSLGAAGVLALAALVRAPRRWTGAALAGWSGYCLLKGSLELPEESVARPEPRPGLALPPKSRERKLAETDAAVRSAVEDEREADEERAARDSGFNPHPPLDPSYEFSEDEPPRFDP